MFFFLFGAVVVIYSVSFARLRCEFEVVLGMFLLLLFQFEGLMFLLQIQFRVVMDLFLIQF